VRIEASRPHDIQIDGDHLGTGKVISIRVDKGALAVRVP
jgi:diacylglycerol kinase family enzyme